MISRSSSAASVMSPRAGWTPILRMWDQFADLGELETHVLGTSQQEPTASLHLVIAGIESQRFRLRPPV